MPTSDASPQSPPLDAAPNGLIAALQAKPGLLQFLKFCTVGSSNMAIDFTVAFALTFALHFNVWLASTISFIVAVSNSFYWNGRWTFADRRKENKNRRYVLFVAINATGLVINLVIMKAVMFISTGSWDHELSPALLFTAKIVATSVVVFWNFFANKHWTFRNADSQ